MVITDLHSYEPAKGHGLKHDPFNAIIAPRPIGWISSKGASGNINLAPYSYFNAVASVPPILAFSSNSWKDTVRNVRETGEFVWNLATMPLARQMNISSAHVPPDISEFDTAGLTPVQSSKVSVPRVGESPAVMECKLIEELRFGEGGKRSIVLGEVLRFHIRDEVLTPRGHVDLDAMKPVGRLAGSGYIRLSDRFDMKRVSHADWQARKRNGSGP